MSRRSVSWRPDSAPCAPCYGPSCPPPPTPGPSAHPGASPWLPAPWLGSGLTFILNSVSLPLSWNDARRASERNESLPCPSTQRPGTATTLGWGHPPHPPPPGTQPAKQEAPGRSRGGFICVSLSPGSSPPCQVLRLLPALAHTSLPQPGLGEGTLVSVQSLTQTATQLGLDPRPAVLRGCSGPCSLGCRGRMGTGASGPSALGSP